VSPQDPPGEDREGTTARLPKWAAWESGASRAAPVDQRRRWLRAVPALVWVLVGLNFALLLSFSVLYPAYAGYDEPQHVDMVIALQHGDGWPAPGKRTISLGVARSSRGIASSPVSRPYDDVTPPPRSQRQSLEQLGGDRPSTGLIPNQIVQHPPLYYAMGAAILRVLPGSDHWAYDRTVWVLRFLSVLLITPLPLLAWATARHLTGSPAIQQASAALPLAIPGLSRVGSSVNNDNLITLATAAVMVVLASVMAGDLRKRTGVGAGLLLALALLAKGFGLLLIPVVILAYAVGWWRTRARVPWQPLALALVIGGVLGGWWWLRNLILFGQIQPNGLGAPTPSLGKPVPPGGFHFWSHYFMRYMNNRFWSGLGLPEPPYMSWAVGWSALGVVLVGVALALLLGTGGRGSRAMLIVLLLPTLLIGAAVAADAWSTYTKVLVPLAIQGRYLYPGVTCLSVLVAVGFGRLLRRAVRLLPALALAMAGCMQLIGFAVVVRGLWLPGPGSGLSEALHGITAWSPWPRTVTLAPFVACVVLAAPAVVLAMRWLARRDGPPALARSAAGQ
jgi:small subunit ribosomal protein S36